MNNEVLDTVTRTNFNVKNYPYVQSTDNQECLETFIHDSKPNMFPMDFATYLKIGASAFVLVASNFV